MFHDEYGNPFLLGSKGQSYESQNIAGVGLCTLVSAGFFAYRPFLLVRFLQEYISCSTVILGLVFSDYGDLISVWLCWTIYAIAIGFARVKNWTDI